MAEQNSSAPATTSSAPSAAPEPPRSLVIRSWPKIILMLPTLIMAVLAGAFTAGWDVMYGPLAPTAGLEARHWFSLLFLFVLGINLTMLLYDLNLKGFILVALLIAVLVLGISLIDRGGTEGEGLWHWVGRILSVRAYANGAFYCVLSIILFFNLAIAWIITRFNYWVVERNEIIIHRGFMQEVERHPTAQARFKMQIEDVVEFGILGVGKLVFYLGDDETVHELPNVCFVHKKSRQLDDLLGRVAVTAQG